jgi:RNA polymerase sigma factor (sigma-70 family)
MQPTVQAELRKTAALHPESVSDGELMLLLQDSPAKDEQDFLFAEFYRRFHPRVTAWCFRISRDRTRALDLAQEVFLKAWRHLHNFRGDSRPSTWLYVITRNHCFSSAQRLACDPLVGGAPLPTKLWDSTLPHPDARIEQKQMCKHVCELMDEALEPMEARIMALHYGYEVPLGTITARMALQNPSGAKAYIVNGRRKMKHALTRGDAPKLKAYRSEAA